MQVGYTGTEEVLKALADVGRTEDVQFSADGKRLAIAGFTKGRILVLEVESMVPERIHFSRATTLLSASFSEPHGLIWVDSEVLLIANRRARVVAVRAPLFANAQELLVHPIQTLGSEADFTENPGSVTLRAFGPDLVEALVCNNYVHRVTRHIMKRDGLSVVTSETVFRSNLQIPDGVVFSHSGTWIAVSNHNDNSVFLYRADQLGSGDQPLGRLRGMGYPHGISFSPDDRAFFVADAGAPFAHMFVSPDGDWAGDRIPSGSIRVMDDETFARGHSNPEEGGPKGLTVTPDGSMICITDEEQPLAFIDVREDLTRAGVLPRERVKADDIDPVHVNRSLAATMQRTRDEFAASLRREREANQRTQAATSRAATAEAEAVTATNRARALETQAQRVSDTAVRELEQQLHHLQMHAKTLEQRTRQLRSRLKSANGRSRRMKVQANRARRQARAIVNSTSWRLTAPLRALSRLFSRRT